MQKLIIRSLLLAFLMLAVSVPAFSQVAVGVSVNFGPPAIPVYDQPVCPGDGYIWAPGYWAWDSDFDDYYWVPGTWVEPPEVGLLWTPGYWGWNGAGFVFTDGYWGPVVGFYGGINYGFGYFGTGFVGGRWEGGHFYYNTAVWHVNSSVVHNTYVDRVTIMNDSRVSYNGGNGGITTRATAQEQAARNERHMGAVAAQTQQIEAARGNRDLRASVNHGKPPIAATDRAGAFSGSVEKAKDAGGRYNPPADQGGVNARAENRTNPEDNVERGNAVNTGRIENNSNNRVVHPNDIPAPEKPPAPNTGNAKLDQKYRQQQQKLADQQQNQRQKLEQRQEKEHQQYQKQQANEQKTQQLEQKHAQQTQQLQQHQEQQRQQLEKRQAPPPSAHSSEHATPEKEDKPKQ